MFEMGKSLHQKHNLSIIQNDFQKIERFAAKFYGNLCKSKTSRESGPFNLKTLFSYYNVFKISRLNRAFQHKTDLNVTNANFH